MKGRKSHEKLDEYELKVATVRKGKDVVKEAKRVREKSATSGKRKKKLEDARRRKRSGGGFQEDPDSGPGPRALSRLIKRTPKRGPASCRGKMPSHCASLQSPQRPLAATLEETNDGSGGCAAKGGWLIRGWKVRRKKRREAARKP
uniref:Uncharacterized protein n=1 Tax=Vespula pensylvanica TaxID=30213 RepID=A0A834KEZ0_VESPE|nr:hypothetical protein H0235_014375 [Vespula pensylvanica]